MESRRTSRRVVSTCQSVSNPLSRNLESPLSAIIPHSISKHVDKKSNISCQLIDELPTFQPGSDMKDELERIKAAT